MKKFLIIIYFFSFSLLALAQAVGDYGSGMTGDWSDPLIWRKWDGTGFNTTVNTVPTVNDNVYIVKGNTVTLDPAVANCKNLTVRGTLYTSKIQADSLTVMGSVFVDTGATFKSQTNTVSTNLRHVLALYGDFTNLGTMDFRNGTNGSTLGAVHTYFLGDANSTVTMGAYSASNNEFTAITIKKTGGANVICGSDVVMSQGNSTNLPAQLIFVSGKIITNNYKFVMLSTSSADLVVPIPTGCWVVGEMGRGMSNSAGKTNMFPVGDANSYRPLNMRSTTGGVASAHYVTVRLIPGAANLNNSTYTSDIDKVSQVRYYKVGYNFYTAGAADTMRFDRFYPSYGNDDGVAPGNTHLRAAYSIDERLNWIGINDSNPDTTAPSDVPKTLTVDSLVAPGLVLHAGTGSIYVALARVAGTTENLLGPVDVRELNSNPTSFTLLQNYPNPFNPSTVINYSVTERTLVSLKVFDALGKEVATLVNGEREAGTYNVNFTADNLSNGVYFYKLTAGNFSSVKKMLLLK